MTDLDILTQRLDALRPKLAALLQGRTMNEAVTLAQELLEPLGMEADAAGIWTQYSEVETRVLRECGFEFYF